MTLEQNATDSAAPVFEPSDTPQPDAPVLYPIGSTAYSKSLVTRVTITDVRHDARQIEWHRGEDPRPFTNSHSIHELGDSDDPYTIAALAKTQAHTSEWQVGSKVAMITNGHTGYVIKSDDNRLYVEFKSGSRNWVPIAELELIAPPSNMPVLPDWIAVDVEAQNDQGQIGMIRSIHWTPKLNEWLMTFETKSGIEDLLVREIFPLTTDREPLTPDFKPPLPDEAPLTLTPPADPLTIDQAESHIAQDEIDAAQMVTEFGKTLAGRDAKIKHLEALLEEQTAATKRAVGQYVVADRERKAAESMNEEAYDARKELEARIKLLEEENEDLKSKRVQFVTTPTQPRQIETLTKRSIPDREIADLLNQGWRVAFETVYNQPGNAAHTHMLRFERECPDAATSPQDEARAFVMPPRAAEPETDAVSEDESTMHQKPAEIVFHVNEANSILDVYEDIDPRHINLNRPLIDNLRQYGPDAVGKAQDLVILNSMATTALTWNQETQRLTSHVRPFPVRAIAAQ